MSSELLEYLDNDENGSTVLLTYRASGYGFLSISGKEDEDGNIVKDYYCLSPDENGWENAQTIIDALTGWIEHTKRINHKSHESHNR